MAAFAPFADEYGRITLYVEGVNGSGQLGDYTVSVVAEHGTYTYEDALRFTVLDAELTAYRAGARFGEAIPESIEGMGEANLFYVQINNDAEERLDGYNIDSGNDRAVIPPVREGGPWSGDDDDLVRIRLHQLKVVPPSGQVRIEFLPEEGQRPWVSNPVRIFDAEGNQLYFDGYELGPPGYGVTVNTYELLAMDLANPQGPLAGLLSGDVDLWLEGVEATTHFGIQLLIATSGATDQVHMRLPDWRPELVTVAFTDGEGLDGIPMKDYYDDQNGNNECDPGESLGDTSITGPEYVRDTGRNKYALVQAGTRFHVQSRFKLDVPPELLEDPVMAWALADNSNFDLSPVELIQESPGSDYWSGLFQVEVAPDAIDVLDITWEWHIVMSDLELSERSQHTVLVCLAAPSTFPATSTSESPDATLAKWASESAAGQTGDTNILNALISRTNLEKIGAYTLPPRYPANHPWAHLERDTYEPLVAFKRGSCGHWADLFQVAANLEAVEVVKNGFITLRLPDWPNVSDFAIGLQTRVLQPIGGAPRPYDFGDHEWCEYGTERTVYDPSFAVVFTLGDAKLAGTTALYLWQEYLRLRIIDGTAFYVRNPQTWVGDWRIIGDGADLTNTVKVRGRPWDPQGGYVWVTRSDRYDREYREQHEGKPYAPTPLDVKGRGKPDPLRPQPYAFGAQLFDPVL